MRHPFQTLKASTTITVTFLAVASMALAAACSSETRAVDLGREPGPPPSFESPEAGPPTVDGSVPIAPLALCIATECPALYGTCSAGHKCATDLSNDPHNCGECGLECPFFPDLFTSPTCSGGKCRYECRFAEFLDCNGLVEDGCEIHRMTDPTNCGSCGHVCPDGVSCVDGECGCPPGRDLCNAFCADLKNDISNCGACGKECPPWYVEGWDEPPPNMMYDCHEGACQHLTCAPGFANCDGDLENGCEVDNTRDSENCAQCGQKCGPDQVCALLNETTVPACLCNAGQTLCGDGEQSAYACADLLSDKKHCGACYNDCDARGLATPNTAGDCTQGKCSRKCLTGYADCDGDPSNGCEVNLRTDGSNCGSCGNWCAAAKGQPCIAGSCLTVECDGGAGETK